MSVVIGVISRVESKSPELMEHGLNVGFLRPLWAILRISIRHYEGTGPLGRIVNFCRHLNGVNAHMGTVNITRQKKRSATRTATLNRAPLGITANIICLLTLTIFL